MILYVSVYCFKISTGLLEFLDWYFCLLNVSGFQKVTWSQISLEVGIEKPLLDEKLKRKAISYENVSASKVFY